MECDTPLEKLYHKKKKGEGCVFKDVSKYKNLFLLNYQISISRNTFKFNTLKKSIIYLSLKKPWIYFSAIQKSVLYLYCTCTSYVFDDWKTKWTMFTFSVNKECCLDTINNSSLAHVLTGTYSGNPWASPPPTPQGRGRGRRPRQARPLAGSSLGVSLPRSPCRGITCRSPRTFRRGVRHTLLPARWPGRSATRGSKRPPPPPHSF